MQSLSVLDSVNCTICKSNVIKNHVFIQVFDVLFFEEASVAMEIIFKLMFLFFCRVEG